MQIDQKSVNGATLLAPQFSRLDAAVAVPFKERVARLIESGDDRLVIDLQRVTYMDSSGLGAIVALLKRVGRTGHLRLANVQGPVARLLTMTRLDRVLDLYESVEAALADAGK